MHDKFSIRAQTVLPSIIILKSILFIVITLGLSGCVTFNDPEVSQEQTADPVAILDSSTTVGQSFISRRPYLNSVTIWISSVQSNKNNPPINSPLSVTAELFYHPEDQTPLYSTTLVTFPSTTSTLLTIPFPKVGDTPNLPYYLKLSTDSGAGQILGRNDDAYASGEAYIDGIPVNSDIAFRATYEYNGSALLHDLTIATSQIWLFFPLLAVLFLPGSLLLEFSGFAHKFDIGERWAISIGLSLAIVPVLMLWTTQLHIRWSETSILVVSIFMGAIFLLRLIHKFLNIQKNWQTQGSIKRNHTSEIVSSNESITLGQFIALIAIFLGTLTIRLVMVRDLVTPAWVDSVHHALFTRLIITNGNYPSSYLPFLDLPVASYHLGFHSVAAAFTMLSGLKLEQALLLLGQCLNAVVIFSVYLMTKTITRSTSAGLFSAVITGFLTPMPAYYTSWGRYTELTGLIILPVAFTFLHSFKFDLTIKAKRWMLFLGALSSAGLFLVHYRVIVFLALLIISSILVSLLYKIDNNYSTRRYLQNILLISAFGIILVAPWLNKVIQTIVIPTFTRTASIPVPFFQDFSWAFLTSALGEQSLILAGLGLFWAMSKKQDFAFLLILWVVLLFTIANLGALNLPGGGLISSASVEIMLFIPISIFGGYLIAQITYYWKSFTPKQLYPVLACFMVIIVGAVSWLGAQQLVNIINPITILTRSADIPALEWVKDQIPNGETVVINPSPWGYGIYAGNDGGYWISSLAGKPTLPPSVLYGLGTSSNQINEISQQIISLGSEPASLKNFLLNYNYKYVFIGAKGGAISPGKLEESGQFITRYHQSNVWIFEVKP